MSKLISLIFLIKFFNSINCQNDKEFEAAKSFKDLEKKKCEPNEIGKQFPTEDKTCTCVRNQDLNWSWDCFHHDNSTLLYSKDLYNNSTRNNSEFEHETKKGRNMQDVWELFKKMHNKFYESAERAAKAKDAFIRTLSRVMENNEKFQSGSAAQKLAINEFADVDHESWASNRFGIYKKRKLEEILKRPMEGRAFTVSNAQPPPAFLDWRTSYRVSPVRYQNPCGDCWTFATMGAVESQMLIKTGRYVPLSVQQLVDCDTTQGYGGGGCNGGGWPDLAMIYLQTFGAMSDASYQYSSGALSSQNYNQTGQCAYNGNSVVQRITGMKQVPMPTDDETLKAALYNQGPLALIVDARSWDPQYAEGYLTCPTEPQVEHAVLLVGYSDHYWIIKNQWGTGWGYQGFGFIPRGQDCGVTKFQAVSPTIA